MKEKVTQAVILAYLKSRGDMMAWRNNTGSYSPRPGAFVRYGDVGSADILAVQAPMGRLVGVEVKSTRGRLRPAQERWGAQLERVGGQYIVARTLDDVKQALGDLTGEPEVS